MITILTTTYNRVHTLPKLYESLLKQNTSFEWLVIDDGSNDDTKEYIENVINQNIIPIRYIRQVNQGKHIAINTGVKHAKGEWIFIVDSDDCLTTDALAIIEKDIDLYGETHELCYRKKLLNGQLVGNTIHSSSLELSATEAGNLLKGDLAYIFKKSILEMFPFPKISSENFVPELYIWNKISDNNKIMVFPNQPIYICEYLEDGYTKRFKENLRKNPMGFLLFYRSQIKYEKSLIRKLKCIIRSLQCIYFIK